MAAKDTWDDLCCLWRRGLACPELFGMYALVEIMKRDGGADSIMLCIMTDPPRQDYAVSVSYVDEGFNGNGRISLHLLVITLESFRDVNFLTNFKKSLTNRIQFQQHRYRVRFRYVEFVSTRVASGRFKRAIEEIKKRVAELERVLVIPGLPELVAQYLNVRDIPNVILFKSKYWAKETPISSESS